MKEKHKSRFMAVMKEDMGLVLVTGGGSGGIGWDEGRWLTTAIPEWSSWKEKTSKVI